ncbi:MAG: hypothetical protein IPJ95_00130 [Gemmatimonadetes bacterium]|nr:hypothetical protein [Gemmatimonadota bacterium]
MYSAYDSQQRLVKSWTNTVTGLGQGVRLDSLVYDASHRVIVHVDSRGKADSVFYDAKGNVIKTKDPSGAVTQFWYSSTTGQLDSMLPPSTTARQRYTYDATWKNPTTVSAGATTAGSVQQSQSTYDSYGRVASTLSWVQVRVTGSTVKWQWRKTVPTYVAATNEVTTQTSYRSDTCDPCVGGPASWPSDSFHVMTVSVFRDAAGRDTARVGERGYQTVYTYDRLGRLLARRPPSAGGPRPGTRWCTTSRATS